MWNKSSPKLSGKVYIWLGIAAHDSSLNINTVYEYVVSIASDSVQLCRFIRGWGVIHRISVVQRIFNIIESSTLSQHGLYVWVYTAHCAVSFFNIHWLNSDGNQLPQGLGCLVGNVSCTQLSSRLCSQFSAHTKAVNSSIPRLSLPLLYLLFCCSVEPFTDLRTALSDFSSEPIFLCQHICLIITSFYLFHD